MDYDITIMFQDILDKIKFMRMFYYILLLKHVGCIEF